MLKNWFTVCMMSVGFGSMIAAAAPPVSDPGAANDGGRGQQWQFKVSLGDKEIGRQTFKIDQRGERSTVAIAADLNVRYVALSFYEYKHRNTEIWRGNCLESIRASTDDNGEKLSVEGSRVNNGFQVQATKVQMLLPECIMSFAYWNPDFLKQNRLLNSQTGTFEEVNVSKVGSERIMVRRQPVDATRYKLKGKGIDIDLWYAGDRQWVRLESEVNKSRLIYELI